MLQKNQQANKNTELKVVTHKDRHMFNISTWGMVIYNLIKYLSFEAIAQNTPDPIKSHKQMQQFITLQCFC